MLSHCKGVLRREAPWTSLQDLASHSKMCAADLGYNWNLRRSWRWVAGSPGTEGRVGDAGQGHKSSARR